MAQNNPQPQQNQQVPIKVTDEVLKGVYSTQVMIRHTKQEFVMDFISFIPGDSNGIVSSRVILSPAHMKALFAALQENIKRYEAQFNVIEAGTTPVTPTTTSSSDSIGFDTAKAA